MLGSCILAIELNDMFIISTVSPEWLADETKTTGFGQTFSDVLSHLAFILIMPVCPANNATTGESYLEKKNQTLYPRNRTVCNELRDVGYQSRPRNERGDHYLSFFSSYCTDKTPRTLMDNTRRKERKKERKILNEIKKRERPGRRMWVTVLLAGRFPSSLFNRLFAYPAP